MPCDVPASVFANAPEMRVVPAGSRYFLTLLPNHRPQSNATTHTPPGWGWVDDRLEDLATAIRTYCGPLAGYSIWRRTDGVMICARDAAARSKLMAMVNLTVAAGTTHYCSEHRHCHGVEGTRAHSVPNVAMAAQASSAHPPAAGPHVPRPLTVYSGLHKRSPAAGPRPNSLARSVTPPPEGPRKRRQRLAAADSTLRNMGDAIAQLQQATLTLRDTLQDLRSFV